MAAIKRSVATVIRGLGGLVLVLGVLVLVLALWRDGQTARGSHSAIKGGQDPGGEQSSCEALPCRPARPCLALIIDDIGRDVDILRRLLRLPQTMTFAVLPHAPHTQASVALLKAHRRPYMLHLPMEPLHSSSITDEPVVLDGSVRMNPLFWDALRQVPGAVAINNHMGSALSQRPAPLRALMRLVRQSGLPFVDSKTISETRICEVAHRWAVPCRMRDLFLDQEKEVDKIKRNLKEGMELAKQRGYAVVIGHPIKATLEALADFGRRYETDVFVPITALFADRLGTQTLRDSET